MAIMRVLLVVSLVSLACLVYAQEEEQSFQVRTISSNCGHYILLHQIEHPRFIGGIRLRGGAILAFSRPQYRTIGWAYHGASGDDFTLDEEHKMDVSQEVDVPVEDRNENERRVAEEVEEESEGQVIATADNDSVGDIQADGGVQGEAGASVAFIRRPRQFVDEAVGSAEQFASHSFTQAERLIPLIQHITAMSHPLTRMEHFLEMRARGLERLQRMSEGAQEEQEDGVSSYVSRTSEGAQEVVLQRKEGVSNVVFAQAVGPSNPNDVVEASLPRDDANSYKLLVEPPQPHLVSVVEYVRQAPFVSVAGAVLAGMIFSVAFALLFSCAATIVHAEEDEEESTTPYVLVATPEYRTPLLQVDDENDVAEAAADVSHYQPPATGAAV
eukprot:jgi/Mesen1/4230/ME000022S03521